MCIPKIFRWPSPWMWGAIIVLVCLGSEGSFLAWLCVVVIAASLIHYMRRGRGEDTERVRMTGTDRDVDQRLMEIERRLTDTQDVMIALSEKMDTWEAEQSSRRDEAVRG